MSKTTSSAENPPSVVYTIKEEIANSITHAIGVGLSIAGLVLLVVYAARFGDAWRVVSAAIYGSSLLLLYLASTLYHTFQNPRIKRLLRIFDHSAIYLLIAGSYTPFMLVTLRGPVGWTLFGVVWSIALGGIIFKTFFIGRFEKLSTAAYVLMGWICIFAFREMMASLSPMGLAWLIIGGVVYTLGVIFYAWKKLPYNHAIWHLFVLGGSTCHFFAVYLHVLPGP